jgi:hypothetical protein
MHAKAQSHPARMHEAETAPERVTAAGTLKNLTLAATLLPGLTQMHFIVSRSCSSIL